MYLEKLGFALLGLAISGCAREPERPEPLGYFVTHIEDDGTKKYQYTLEMEQADRKSGNGRPGNTKGHLYGNSRSGVSGGVTAGSVRSRSGGTRRQGGQERYQQITERLENMLEKELKNSGYCHQGNRELERVVNPPTIFIRGKCEETASDEDLQQFHNNT